MRKEDKSKIIEQLAAIVNILTSIWWTLRL